MVEGDKEIFYLLHNNFLHENEISIPIQPGTFAFCQRVMYITRGTIKTQNVEMFRGANIEKVVAHDSTVDAK